MPVVIDRSGADKWRWTCPHGHMRWELREESIWCVSCDRSPLFESGRYYNIIDQKQRTELPVEEVSLQ